MKKENIVFKWILGIASALIVATLVSGITLLLKLDKSMTEIVTTVKLTSKHLEEQTLRVSEVALSNSKNISSSEIRLVKLEDREELNAEARKSTKDNSRNIQSLMIKQGLMKAEIESFKPK